MICIDSFQGRRSYRSDGRGRRYNPILDDRRQPFSTQDENWLATEDVARFRTPEESKWEERKHSFDIHYDPENWWNDLHQNICIHLQNYTVLQQRCTQPEQSPEESPTFWHCKYSLLHKRLTVRQILRSVSLETQVWGTKLQKQGFPLFLQRYEKKNLVLIREWQVVINGKVNAQELKYNLVWTNGGHVEVGHDHHPSKSLFLNTLQQLHCLSWINSFHCCKQFLTVSREGELIDQHLAKRQKTPRP